MARYLVLGGAGYIGSHTVYELIANGDEAVVADSLVTGHRQAVHPAAAFERGDIHDRAFMDSLFKKYSIDCVIHFAAFSLVGESVRDPLKYYNNNVSGTVSVLEAMAANGVKNIVFSSSAAVYGEPERVPITEDAPKHPTNPYGATKRTMEEMMAWCDAAYGMRFASLRYFNACGALEGGTIGEDHSPETHLIPLVLRAAQGKGELRVFGTDYETRDGTCVRDYIHVCDLARAHHLAAKYLLAGGKSDVFNLGNGEGFTVKEVIDAARRVTGARVPFTETARRAGDPAQLVASNEKAARVLGFTPRISSMEAMIASAWAWHAAHPEGFSEDATRS